MLVGLNSPLTKRSCASLRNTYLMINMMFTSCWGFYIAIKIWDLRMINLNPTAVASLRNEFDGEHDKDLKFDVPYLPIWLSSNIVLSLALLSLVLLEKHVCFYDFAVFLLTASNQRPTIWGCGRDGAWSGWWPSLIFYASSVLTSSNVFVSHMPHFLSPD